MKVTNTRPNASAAVTVIDHTETNPQNLTCETENPTTVGYPVPTELDSTVTDLRAQGLRLLPLPPKQKFPPPTGWTETDAEYAFTNGGNIAIATGPARHGPVVVISNDDRSTDYFTGLFGPPTMWSHRGAHWWFRAPPGTEGIAASTYAHGEMEMHGDGRYVLVPPSIHPTGTPYRWDHGEPRMVDLPELPADIRDVFGIASPPDGGRPPAGRVDGKVPYGQRRRFLCATARTLAEAGLTEDKVREELRRIQETKFPPERPGDRPYTSGAEYVARWAFRHHSPAKGPADAPAAPHIAQSARPHPECWIIVGEGEKKHEDPVRAGFVRVLEREFTFATLAANAKESLDELLYYRDGVYVPAEPVVREWVEREFRSRGKTSWVDYRSQVQGAIRAVSHVAREEFNPAGLVNLSNGVLDPSTGKAKPHTPEVRFLYKLPIAYDPTATCPRFDRFLEEVLPELGHREFLAEWLGYCLTHGNPHQVALILVGGGANGKTTLVRTIQAMFAGAYSTETLQDLNAHRFSRGNLLGKLLNICDDMPSNDVKETGPFKMLTGESALNAERKFRDAVPFVNAAKAIFTANRLPKVDDNSEAFWRRIHLLTFPVTIPYERRDPKLLGALTQETPGILNLAIRGLARLQERGRFDAPATLGDTRDEWRRLSDSLSAFVNAEIVRDQTTFVVKAVFMIRYGEYCDEQGLGPDTASEVGSKLPGLVPGVHAEKPRIGGRQVPVWKGIRFRDDTDSQVGTLDRPFEPTEPTEMGGTYRAEDDVGTGDGVDSSVSPVSPGSRPPNRE
jgi:putative DNA primase/helicase